MMTKCEKQLKNLIGGIVIVSTSVYCGYLLFYFKNWIENRELNLILINSVAYWEPQPDFWTPIQFLLLMIGAIGIISLTIWYLGSEA